MPILYSNVGVQILLMLPEKQISRWPDCSRAVSTASVHIEWVGRTGCWPSGDVTPPSSHMGFSDTVCKSQECMHFWAGFSFNSVLATLATPLPAVFEFSVLSYARILGSVAIWAIWIRS